MLGLDIVAHAMRFTEEETGVPWGLQWGGDEVGSEAHTPAPGFLSYITDPSL